MGLMVNKIKKYSMKDSKDYSILNRAATLVTNGEYKPTYQRILIRNKESGEMGVPVTFLEKHDPEQFEIIGVDFDYAEPVELENGKKMKDRFYVNNDRLYSRVVIRLVSSDDD